MKRKLRYFYILFQLLLLTLLGCTSRFQDNYSIVEINFNNEIKFAVSVRIDKCLSEESLKNIALKVKSEINAKSGIGYVFFVLPEKKTNNAVWASVEFRPEPVVITFEPPETGNESADNAAVIESQYSADKKYMGLWIDNSSGELKLFGIRNDKREGFVKEYVSPTTFEAEIITFPLNRVKTDGIDVFKEKQSPSGDYYLIENWGDLSSYNNKGYITTYKRKI